MILPCDIINLLTCEWRSIMYRSNNKGFTLIELIIVIAIIAILAAVVTPQYLKYVERAKESNDVSIANSLIKIASLALVDPSNNVPAGAIIEVAWSTDGQHSKDGALIVRSPVCYSPLWSGGGSWGDATLFEKLDKELSEMMSISATGDTNTSSIDYYGYLMDDAQSVVGNTDDFIIHIDTTTGQVAVSNESLPWVTKLGISAMT